MEVSSPNLFVQLDKEKEEEEDKIKSHDLRELLVGGRSQLRVRPRVQLQRVVAAAVAVTVAVFAVVVSAKKIIFYWVG